MRFLDSVAPSGFNLIRSSSNKCPFLSAPFRQVQEVARKIAQVENECKLDTDVDEYVDKFKWELMSVVHAWANISLNPLLFSKRGCRFN